MILPSPSCFRPARLSPAFLLVVENLGKKTNMWRVAETPDNAIALYIYLAVLWSRSQRGVDMFIWTQHDSGRTDECKATWFIDVCSWKTVWTRRGCAVSSLRRHFHEAITSRVIFVRSCSRQISKSNWSCSRAFIQKHVEVDFKLQRNVRQPARRRPFLPASLLAQTSHRR